MTVFGHTVRKQKIFLSLKKNASCKKKKIFFLFNKMLDQISKPLNECRWANICLMRLSVPLMESHAESVLYFASLSL